ncbi:SDR family NAD(P)-dependent oxidoreductase [Nonomuraea sp. NPDC048826]|uniref:SDR family NAD(P)-dependent oxidoreductase n=1 Tax=Nonomuraea sp. NPDC048826 TaxID=3364347 RepID=UPI00370F91D7
MHEQVRVALVTGASRGLGAAIARRLGADGWAVGVNYRSDAAGAAAVVDEIRAAGGRAEAFPADVTDEAATAGLAARVTRELGPVEALVLNATGPQPELGVEELTWQAQLDQLTFFVKSPTLLVQACLPAMRERGRGRVIQIGSDVVDRTLPRTSAYTSAKAAQHAMTRCWARELGPYGITVNVVAPGWIPVERHAGLDADDYVAEVPVGRIGTPRDVAAAVAYLASDEAAYVTGQRLTVNGGHTPSPV